ncbi:MAG: anthranilate phosphoribosyltransferase [Dehalococcoidia bacterium]|nr:anthranilate phosphoribosyltransferase [Dehalococcoidia bacterium]
MIKEAIARLVEGRDLPMEEAAQVMREIMGGEATPAQMAAFLVALRAKGETVDEIAGLARIMREKAARVAVTGPVVDTCGTGGDSQGTFNISTTAAFVVAGAGVKVAKHGNRAMSSHCGSADVLEALGVKIDLGPEGVARCLAEAGVGFMFAQVFHPAMKFVAPVRREIGIRTVFNILGPLTNPAGAQAQVIGVASPAFGPKLAQALQRLGARHVFVVHGAGGLDEISPAGETQVWETKDGQSREFKISPSDFGLAKSALADIKGGTVQENAQMVRDVLRGKPGPRRDVVVMNAAAALFVSGHARNLAEGARQAEESLDSGQAAQKLEALVRVSQAAA